MRCIFEFVGGLIYLELKQNGELVIAVRGDGAQEGKLMHAGRRTVGFCFNLIGTLGGVRNRRRELLLRCRGCGKARNYFLMLAPRIWSFGDLALNYFGYFNHSIL